MAWPPGIRDVDWFGQGGTGLEVLGKQEATECSRGSGNELSVAVCAVDTEVDRAHRPQGACRGNAYLVFDPLGHKGCL